MSIQAWQEERQRIRIEEALLGIEEEKRAGIAKYVPAHEIFVKMDSIIQEAQA